MPRLRRFGLWSAVGSWFLHPTKGKQRRDQAKGMVGKVLERARGLVTGRDESRGARAERR